MVRMVAGRNIGGVDSGLDGKEGGRSNQDQPKWIPKLVHAHGGRDRHRAEAARGSVLPRTSHERASVCHRLVSLRGTPWRADQRTLPCRLRAQARGCSAVETIPAGGTMALCVLFRLDHGSTPRAGLEPIKRCGGATNRRRAGLSSPTVGCPTGSAWPGAGSPHNPNLPSTDASSTDSRRQLHGDPRALG